MGYTPPYLLVNRVGAGYRIVPPSSTPGDYLRILPNTIDTSPKIDLTGSSFADIAVPSTKGVRIYDDVASTILRFDFSTPDSRISTYTDYNLFLNPNGSGKVKFGTYTPGLAVCTGTIAIIDAAGNATRVLVAQP